MSAGGLVALAIAVVAATAAGTAVARAYAVRRRLLDEPGARRSHVVATPRGGGIAIAVVCLCALLAVPGWNPVLRVPASLAAAALLLVAGIGWLDDHRPLSPVLRLAVHGVAATLVALAAAAAGLPPVLALAGFAATLVLVNAWNFMDGIDGLAASQAFLFGLAGMALAGTGAPGGIAGGVLAAACAGFLPFNVPRARIFLGDVGSGALGLLVAVVALRVIADGVPAALLLLPASAFLVDTALTLGRRMLRGERWWTPHVQHAYQCAARRSGHLRVTCAYAGWTVAATALAVVLSGGKASLPFMMGVVSTWYLVGAGAWWWLARDGARTKD